MDQSPFAIEPKFDGERILIHKDNQNVTGVLRGGCRACFPYFQ